MNKFEAIDALFAGKKIRRRFWSEGLYLCLKEGKLFKSNGNPVESTEDWADDWELVSVASFKHGGKNYIVTEDLTVEQV